MTRRSSNTTAHELDPTAVSVADLASRHTLTELQAERRRLQAILDECPPDVTDELAAASRTLETLSGRPRRLSSHRATEQAEERVRALEDTQALHDAFQASHVDDYANLGLISRAAITLRLRNALAGEAHLGAEFALPRIDGRPDPEADVGLEW